MLPHRARTDRRRGRRSPLATVALIVSGLLLTGGAYTLFTASATASADSVNLSDPATIASGKQLFEANCATCHGLALQGGTGPSLIGVGSASADFQVSTGRMPLVGDSPQAPVKTALFTQQQSYEIAAYIGSIAPGPGIPDTKYLTLTGDATLGGQLFRTNCAMCHNVAGAGGALTQGKYAPNLQNSTPKTIYEAMLSGPQNMPVFNDDNISPKEKQDIITSLKTSHESSDVAGFALGDLGPVAEGLFLWIFGLGAVVAFTVWLTARAN